jgi:hypothetical protein
MDKRPTPPVDEDDVATPAVEVNPDETDLQKPVHDTDPEPLEDPPRHKGSLRQPGA